MALCIPTLLPCFNMVHNYTYKIYKIIMICYRLSPQKPDRQTKTQVILVFRSINIITIILYQTSQYKYYVRFYCQT